MSDAREVVQPRWKRRATEIASAIGGGTPSVTVELLSDAIATALQSINLNVNIQQYAGTNVGSTGIPIKQGVGHVTGNTLPFKVETPSNGSLAVDITKYLGVSIGTANPMDINLAKFGNTAVASLGNGLPTVNVGQSAPIDVNIKKYAGTDVGAPGIPIKQGSGIASGNVVPIEVSIKEFPKYPNNTTKPIPITAGFDAQGTTIPVVVNCETTNNFPSGGGTVSFPTVMDVNITKFGGGTNIASSQYLPVTVNNHPTEIAVKNAVDANNNNAIIPLSSTETAPITQLAVSPAYDNTVTPAVKIPFSVTETNPVSGGSGGGLNITDTTTAFKNALYGSGATTNTTVHEAVETAMDDALVNAAGISVTETAPVTAVKITGDETYGIIMSKNAPIRSAGNVTNSTAPYLSEYWGLVGGLAVNQITHLVSNGDAYNTGWIIRVNGVDVYNQDITYGISTNNNNLISAGPSNVAQTVIDTYHGRKVTLSSTANVWILEPEIRAHQEPLGTIQWETAGSTSGSEYRFTIMDDDGIEYTNQAFYTAHVMNDSFWNNHWPTTWSTHFAGVRVVRTPHHGTNRWQMVAYLDS